MIIFENSRGETVEFSKNNHYKVIGVDGLGGVDSDVQMQKSPYQDGETYIDSLLETRPITIEFIITAQNRAEIYQHRQYLAKVFNQKLGTGLLKFNFGGVVREIETVVEAGPIFLNGQENETGKFQKGLVNLVCPSPYWLDTHTESEPMSAWLGGLSFPLKFPTQFAMKSSAQIFMNDGDVPTPVEIIFSGPATNPIVTNTTTGEFIKVNRTLGENDKLIVNTAFGNKSVQIEDADGNRTNAFNWIDLNSTFWQLEVGYNEIEYNAESGTENATVQIFWRKRYVGV